LRPQEPKNYDVFNKHDYVEILKEKIPRPFIFGPIDFEDLEEKEQPFPLDYWYEHIL
jgi:hypothetical protein